MTCRRAPGRPARRHPDRALLTAYARLLECDDAIEVDNTRSDWDETRMAKNSEAFGNVVESISDLQPVTMEGLKAKADATLVVLERCVGSQRERTAWQQAEQHERLAIRLAQDVLSFCATGDATPHMPPRLPLPMPLNRPPRATRPAE